MITFDFSIEYGPSRRRKVTVKRFKDTTTDQELVDKINKYVRAFKKTARKNHWPAPRMTGIHRNS